MNAQKRPTLSDTGWGIAFLSSCSFKPGLEPFNPAHHVIPVPLYSIKSAYRFFDFLKKSLHMKGFYNINRYFKIGVVCAKLAFSVNSATECEIEIKQRRKTHDLILVIIFK